MNEKTVGFTVTGTFVIPDGYIPEYDCNGTIVGYILPNGDTVKLIVALEKMEEKTGVYNYITSETEMATLGFESLNYDQTDFEEIFED